MSSNLQAGDFEKLEEFIKFVDENPRVLNMPQLHFMKKLVEKLGGKIPKGDFKMPTGGKCPFGGHSKSSKETQNTTFEDDNEEDDSVESEIELDMTGVIEPDSDVNQSMGDATKIPNEDDINKASELRSKAAGAYSEGNYDQAINYYSQAIELNANNALFYAKRGQVFLKLNKPNCCIRDCDRALEINCDSAAGYKFRGRAHRLLGNWEEAAKDLRQACKLDFDEETDEWLREVSPNAKKIEQHCLKQQRKKIERERKFEDDKRRKDFNKTKQQSQQNSNDFMGSFSDMNFNDILSGIKDPEIMSALQDILKNPSNIEKYKSNPKIAKLIEAITSSFPGGIPSGFPCGMPQAPKSSDTSQKPPEAEKFTKPNFTDDGLD